ncbi:hypothetical protein [Sarcina ventriculi]
MFLNGKINRDHITGALVGVGVCAVGYYIYKKNQNKVDDFLRQQGINVPSQSANFSNMSLPELMETKETLEDLIAERQLESQGTSTEVVEVQ